MSNFFFFFFFTWSSMLAQGSSADMQSWCSNLCTNFLSFISVSSSCFLQPASPFLYTASFSHGIVQSFPNPCLPAFCLVAQRSNAAATGFREGSGSPEVAAALMCRKEFVEWETLSLHAAAAGMAAMRRRSPPLFAIVFCVC
jgi:hypothetical protein